MFPEKFPTSTSHPFIMASGDCSNLDGFQVFKDYLNLIRNRTSFDEALLKQCQEPICQTLWGFGLEDLSGIGVSFPPLLQTYLFARIWC